MAHKKDTLSALLAEALAPALGPGEDVLAWTLAIVAGHPEVAAALLGPAGLAMQSWCFVVLTNERVVLVGANSLNWHPTQVLLGVPRIQARLEVLDRGLFTRARFTDGAGTVVPLKVQRRWRPDLEDVVRRLDATT